MEISNCHLHDLQNEMTFLNIQLNFLIGKILIRYVVDSTIYYS
jgi:hypothetical protein